ncbi:MAG: hypothetical protein ACHQ53_10970 [Polyangiales bacterium]
MRSSRRVVAWALCSVLCSACGAKHESVVEVRSGADAGNTSGNGNHTTGTADAGSGCEMVEMNGDVLLEHEKDFTAHFQIGAPYTKTVMLFGGEPITQDNVVGSAYIFGLDKMDALMLAQKYPDFYLCSSPGGKEASMYIVPYYLVPATCDIYDQIVKALRTYNVNVSHGGDRTSLLLQGSPLQLESVTADATGEDVTSQVTMQNFHLITAVQQLTGESVLSFGTAN